MSPKSMLRTSLRLFIATAMVAVLMPLADHANARGSRSAAAAGKGVVVLNKLKNNQDQDAATEASEAPGNSTEDATAVESAAADGGKPVARAQSVSVVGKAAAPEVEDAKVAGCAPGMMCTICIAGCSGPTDGIVHAERRTSRSQ